MPHPVLSLGDGLVAFSDNHASGCELDPSLWLLYFDLYEFIKRSMMGACSTPSDDDFADQHRGGMKKIFDVTLGSIGHGRYIWTLGVL